MWCYYFFGRFNMKCFTNTSMKLNPPNLKHVCILLFLAIYSGKFDFFSGISGKSQILFAIVYTTRYLDLLTTFISAYNTFMKFIFLAASYATLYLMYVKFKATYDHNHDTFRIEFLLIPAAVLALLINHDFVVLEVSKLILHNTSITGVHGTHFDHHVCAFQITLYEGVLRWRHYLRIIFSNL